jgi:hypothetical protein
MDEEGSPVDEVKRLIALRDKVRKGVTDEIVERAVQIHDEVSLADFDGATAIGMRAALEAVWPVNITLSEALNALDRFALGGVRLEGDDADHLHAAADRIAPVRRDEPVVWMGRPIMQNPRALISVYCSDRTMANQWEFSGHPDYGRMVVTPLYTHAERPGVNQGWPRVYGTSRVANNAKCLLVSFECAPTDDELRSFDDAIKGRRPAMPAAKVVPYGSATGEKDYAYGYEKGYADGWNACREAMLVAAPEPSESEGNGDG